MGERIAMAAIRPRGSLAPVTLLPPKRHHDIITHMAALGFTPGQIAKAEQGFVTNTGRFVTRKEAWQIALLAGQIIPLPGGVPGLLFSENLW